MTATTPVSESESAGEERPITHVESWTAGEASAELRLNREKEPAYRIALMRKILTTPEGVPRDWAVNALAEQIGISPVTSRRYLAKICSENGPLSLVPGTGKLAHSSVLRLREGWFKSQGTDGIVSANGSY